MKLSEAMRAGAKIRPQTYGRLFGAVYDGGSRLSARGSCALGAALEGIGIPEIARTENTVCLIWSRLATTISSCPDCYQDVFEGREGSILGLAIHLNDHHKWSRERIADWIAQFETSKDDVTIPKAVGVREAEQSVCIRPDAGSSPVDGSILEEEEEELALV